MENKIVYLNPADLIDYDRNSRVHSDEHIEQVASSIKEFGFTNPILIDENNIIIAGHGRKAAAVKLGLERVSAIRLTGLTDAQVKALRIADNKIALNSSWDIDLLQAELSELNVDGFDLNLIGFSSFEIGELLEEAAADADDFDDIPDSVPLDADKDSAVSHLPSLIFGAKKMYLQEDEAKRFELFLKNYSAVHGNYNGVAHELMEHGDSNFR